MTEDDDWFERALREDDEDDVDVADDANVADDAGGTDDASEANDETAGVESGGAESPDKEFIDGEPAGDEPGGFADAPEFDAESVAGDDDESFGMSGTDFDSDDDDSTADASPGGGAASSGDGDTSSGGGFADADPYDSDDGDGGDTDLFDEDFATAFENAPGGGPGGAGAPGSGHATGEEAGGGFGSGGGGGFGMDGDEGFGGGFGGGDGESFESEAFDDEEFDSDIPRIDLGIEGLDDMIQGGVPERSLITTVGSAGTGKTTFGLQFLHEALEAGESAVFITLEESHDRIVSTATEKGWDFEAYEDEGSLAVIDLDPIEMANSLTSIRNDLPRLVEDFGATRLVLDSVSLLEMMYDDQATRRNEVYDFTRSLKEAGVTTMLTSEASEDNAYASRHGIIEYLVDAVFVLRYIRSSDDFRETRLAVEIQKIRDANHSREIKPYAITNEGISVYRQANIF